jgi:hypothetical protein
MMPRRRRPPLLLAAGLCGWLAGPPLAAAEPQSFSFGKLNRSYENLVGDLQPITQGPLTVELSSPAHTLVLRANRLLLTPLGEGEAAAQQAHLELELMGKGELVADVEGAGLRTRLQDELYVPPQTLALDARIRLRRGEGGYLVTPLELPRQVEVKIQSKLSNDLLALCDGVALFTGLDCAALERALSVAVIPLPAAGESYLLPDADLSAADRAALDAYLAPTAGAGR